MYNGPRAKSLDKIRGEQKTIRTVGEIEAVFGFSLSAKESWGNISGSVLMSMASGRVGMSFMLTAARSVLADRRPCPLGCVCEAKRLITQVGDCVWSLK